MADQVIDQIVLLQLFSGGASSLVIISSVGAVNSRHLLYGAVVSEHLSDLKLIWKIIISYFLIDQAFAISNEYLKKNKNRKNWKRKKRKNRRSREEKRRRKFKIKAEGANAKRRGKIRKTENERYKIIFKKRTSAFKNRTSRKAKTIFKTIKIR